jgi:ubiquinol-cytochrome c reductase iron-sulfur subunit
VKGPSRVAAGAFVVAIAAALGLFAAYALNASAQVQGALLGLALGGVGVGLLVWAKRLMPEITQETHDRPKAPADAEVASMAETVGAGVEEIKRRKFLARLLTGAIGALGLAAIVPIRSLGQAPGSSLTTTAWTKGSRLVTADGTFVTKDTVELGSFTTVFPEGHAGDATAQAVLIKVEPSLLQLPEDRMVWAPEGLVVYSKICTHAGCPLGLYLAATHELRCPCHQSTFDVLDGAEPVYGPAARPLPQLPIEIGGAGQLVASGDFSAPVGPAFWDLPPS